MIRRTLSKPDVTPRFDQATIAARVRAERERQGLTNDELAAKAGLDHEVLYKRQRPGGTAFKVDELEKIRDALGAPSLFPLLDLEVADMVDKILRLIDARK